MMCRLHAYFVCTLNNLDCSEENVNFHVKQKNFNLIRLDHECHQRHRLLPSRGRSIMSPNVINVLMFCMGITFATEGFTHYAFIDHQKCSGESPSMVEDLYSKTAFWNIIKDII